LRVYRERRQPAFGRNYFQNFATPRRVAVTKNWYEKRDISRKGMSLSARYRENTVWQFFSLPGKGKKKAGCRFSRTYPYVHPQHGFLMARLDK